MPDAAPLHRIALRRGWRLFHVSGEEVPETLVTLPTIVPRDWQRVRLERAFQVPPCDPQSETPILSIASIAGLSDVWLDASLISNTPAASETIRVGLGHAAYQRRILRLELDTSRMTDDARAQPWGDIAIEIHRIA